MTDAPKAWAARAGELHALANAWRDADTGEPEHAAHRALAEALEATLRACHTASPRALWEVGAEALARFRATLLTVALLIALGSGAPQIADLLRQAPWHAFAVSGVGLSVTLVVVILQRIWYVRGRGQSPLMLGWIPFFWMRGEARPAPAGAWPWTPAHGWPQAVVSSALRLWTLTAPAWAVLFYLASMLPDGAKTAAGLVAFGGVLCHVAVFLDFAWYHGARGARRFALVAALAVVVADDAVGFELGVSLVALALGAVYLLGLWRAWRPMSPRWRRGTGALIGLWALVYALGLGLHAKARAVAPWTDEGKGFVHVAAADQSGRPEGLTMTAPSPTCSWPRADDTGPIVILALAGGGARSTQFSARTIETMEQLDARLETQGLPATLAHTELISSVSGGSLTSAAYLARRRRGETMEGLADALHRDYLYPVLAGAVTPGQNRAERLIQSWEHPAVLGESVRLSELAKDACDHGAPLPLFNATTVDGVRVVLSPLDPWAYAPRAQTARAWTTDSYAGLEDPRWVFDRDAVYGFDQLSTYDPTLAESVLASANFPFGFPPVRFATRPERWRFHPEKSRAVSEGLLTDGGVLVNSGLYELYGLLLGQREALSARGVMLVVVDSSFMMPATPQHKHLSQFVTITTKNSVNQRMHRAMLAHLEEVYGDRLQVVVTQMVPEADLDVSTTWYLPRAQHERLHTSFKRQKPALERDLERAWRALHAPSPGKPSKVWQAHPRPPSF